MRTAANTPSHYRITTNGQVSIADKGQAEMGPFIVEETARYKRVIESAGIGGQ